MKLRYVLLAVAGILMYNAFLIQRDERMFKEYYRSPSTQQQQQLTV